MTETALKALALPFSRGNIDLPFEGAKILAINIAPNAALEEVIAAAKMDIIQPWKQAAMAMQNKGAKLIDDPLSAPPQKGEYDIVLFCPTKHREENLGNFVVALEALKRNGILVVAASNEIGAGRIEKTLAKIMPDLQSLSKYKCRCFWARKTGAENVEKWRDFSKVTPILKGRYLSKSGLFGWDKIDKGSALLAAHLPQNLSGNGADFGCGYGWLAAQALKRGLSLQNIHLIDADHRAVFLAAENMSHRTETVKITAHWHDLRQNSPIDRLDWIIMNPPFHEGKSQKASLGLSFLEAAAAALKPKGKLYMVANCHLPYEKVAENLFAKVEKIAEQDGFKLLRAEK